MKQTILSPKLQLIKHGDHERFKNLNFQSIVVYDTSYFH